MTLYEQIGGEPAVKAAIEIFYRKVLDDKILAPMFADVDMTAQSKKARAFFTLLFKAEAVGVSDYMRKSHAHLVLEKGLSDVHFDAVAKHLNDTLRELSVSDDIVAQIMSAAAGLRDAVLNR
jgi:hemoglobin